MQLQQVPTHKKFRPEIEGLRAVAALLVAIYHIWLGKVSGGVDVFFVVSGFLITTSLLSKVRKNGTVHFFDFIFGLLKRLMPSAFFVLLTVVILSFFFMPEVRWVQTIKEVFASALYYENWQLALSSADYLDASNEKSPVQHFWAMSIQGQFYVIWFVVITAALWISKWLKRDIRLPLFVMLVMIFILSLGYSVYLTAVNQPWAYFDTRTRAFEFALGGLLCLTLTKLKLNSLVAGVLGWFGLFMLLFCGLLLNVSSMFPGYIALWPTLAAVFILVSGENSSKFGVERFLGLPFMVKLGSISYGFYLWHWVILTFYYIWQDSKDVPLIDGLLIILISAVLSWLLTYIIEKPVRTLPFNNASWKLAGVLLLIMAPVLLFNSAWKYYAVSQAEGADKLIGSRDYPGAQVYDLSHVEEKDYLPRDASIKSDKAAPYADGCQVAGDDPEVKICTYGSDNNYDYTVALVGGSHSTHWHPALAQIAAEENIRLLNITKSGCRLSTDRKGLPSCDTWNENVIEKIAAEQPDLVFTTAEISYFNVTDVPQGYIEQFEALADEGIEVFGVRDTPYFKIDVPTCIQKYGRNSIKCTVEKDRVVPEKTDWSKLADPPANVHYFDYTDKICPEERCRPVIGNVVGYFDKGHMTKSFNETLAPYIKKDLMPLLEEIKEKRQSE